MKIERPAPAGGVAVAGTASETASLIRHAHVRADDTDAPDQLCDRLGPGPFASVFLFISPQADIEAVAAKVRTCFESGRVIGCTTAGELSSNGYTEGEIVAFALPEAHFATTTILIPDLDDLAGEDLIGRLIRERQALARERPDWDYEFAFLMVDGLSVREDELTATLAPGLGPVPLFGGSAGDGTRFEATFILHGGKALTNAAVLTLVRTDCPVKVFNLDHLYPTERRMVVTQADPRKRIVRQINAEPAAREYARILGKDPGQLDTFTFAANPVVVRIGGRHHVRSIQRVAPNGDLVFFSAIDEGLVLTLAEPVDMVEHLEAALAGLAQPNEPIAILACDCILRRMEAQEKQRSGAVSELLRRHNVVGFSTYGEQLNAMHVNQTMTGVAIYRPGTRLP